MEEGDENLFSLTTINGQAVLKLVKPLDYEKKFLHQVRIIASDRAETAAQVKKNHQQNMSTHSSNNDIFYNLYCYNYHLGYIKI